MREIYIVGNCIYAEMLLQYLKEDTRLLQNHKICGFVVDKQYIQETIIQGLPVVTFEDLAQKPRENTDLVLAIGYSKMGDIRKAIFQRCKDMGFSFMSYHHPTAVIHPSVKCGEGNIILENVILEAGCEIGTGNLFYGGAILGHDSKIGDFNTFSIGAVTAGCVQIKNHCFFGVRSAVKDHVMIEDYVLVGATAYAYQDIPAYFVVHSPRCTISNDKNRAQIIYKEVLSCKKILPLSERVIYSSP